MIVRGSLKRSRLVAAVLICGFVLPIANGMGDEKKTSKWSVGILSNLSQENCEQALGVAFEKRGLTPKKDVLIADAIKQACAANPSRLVLVTPEEEQKQKQLITFDVNGTYADGNTKAASLSVSSGYKRDFDNHTLELKANGAWILEGETLFQNYTLQGSDELFLSNHWAVFVDVSAGQDTRKNLDFMTRELVGTTFNVFGKEHDTQLKFSGAIGHRLEIPVEGQTLELDNSQGFNSNNAILSWRVKFEQKFIDDALELMAALWFQHILYSPGNKDSQSRFVDVEDFRVLGQLSIKIKIAELGVNSKLYSSLDGTYEYYARALGSSPYDLQLIGGLGVSF